MRGGAVLPDDLASRVKFLHPLAVVVGHVYVPDHVHRHRPGLLKLASTHARPSDGAQQRPLGTELADAVPVFVGQVDNTRGTHGQPIERLAILREPE